MKKVAVLTHEMCRNTGIGKFQANAVPPLLEHEGVDPFFFQPREWYPFSMTLETAWYNLRIQDQLDEYDAVFIPAQDRLTFDPRKTGADVIPYVHDIIHGTSTFKKNSNGGRVGAVGFYLSTLLAVRWTRFNAYCDTVVCASEATKQALLQHTAFDGDAHVVYQGVDLPDPVNADVPDYDLVYVGTLIERKDPAFIRDSLQQAVNAGYDVATVNFGPTDLPGDTYVDISDAKLAALYRNSQYYLHPSRTEGFGRGPVEAQSQGCIPLARDIPVNREVLGAVGASWLPIEQPRDVLHFLEEEPVDWMREQARENAARFDWDTTGSQLQEVVLGG